MGFDFGGLLMMFAVLLIFVCWGLALTLGR